MEETLPIWVQVPVDVPATDFGAKGGLFVRGTEAETILTNVPVQRLRENLRALCQGFTSVLADVRAVGDFRLTEVTINVEVTAEGGFELIGSAKVGGKGAITLTFGEPAAGKGP